jgi:hypothetical protein
MIEYTIHKQTEKTVEIIIIDPESGLTHNRTINIGDCTTNDLFNERIESHLRAFKHRINVGVITESSIPATETGLPTDIVIDPSLSKESKLALATVIEAKATEQKTNTEEQLTKLNSESKKDNTAIAEATAKLQTLTTAIDTLVIDKSNIEKE